MVPHLQSSSGREHGRYLSLVGSEDDDPAGPNEQRHSPQQHGRDGPGGARAQASHEDALPYATPSVRPGTTRRHISPRVRSAKSGRDAASSHTLRPVPEPRSIALTAGASSSAARCRSSSGSPRPSGRSPRAAGSRDDSLSTGCETRGAPSVGTLGGAPNEAPGRPAGGRAGVARPARRFRTPVPWTRRRGTRRGGICRPPRERDHVTRGALRRNARITAAAQPAARSMPPMGAPQHFRSAFEAAPYDATIRDSRRLS